MRSVRRAVSAAALSGLAMLVLAPSAFAHARMSPAVSLSGKLQLYSLAIPTEKEGLTTTSITLTVPSGFGIDSFVPSPGWKRSVQSTGSGDNAIVQTVTWTGGNTPTEEDSLFQFLGQPAKSGTYTFTVEQTYSNGKIVNWADPESGANPAPTIEAKASLGGGGTPLLTIIALVVGIVGVVLGAIALFVGGGGKRQLA